MDSDQPQRRGIKRSSRGTFRRQMVLVRLLLRKSQDKHALIAGVQAILGDHGYPEGATSAFKHDLDILKNEYGCSIVYDYRAQCYVIEDLGDLALLELSAEAQAGLAFLQHNFPPGDDALPELAALSSLVDEIQRARPFDQRDQALRSRMALDRLPIAPERIDPGVVSALEQALGRYEIAFAYRGNTLATERLWYRGAPYSLNISRQGHMYLDLTVLEVRPAGTLKVPSNSGLRVDRIVPGSVKRLGRPLPAKRHQDPRQELRYRLVPALAQRRDFSLPFADSEVVFHADGSATVTAQIENLWLARQELLRYGAACEVLAPEALVALFRQTAAGLAELYLEDDERGRAEQGVKPAQGAS